MIYLYMKKGVKKQWNLLLNIFGIANETKCNITYDPAVIWLVYKTDFPATVVTFRRPDPQLGNYHSHTDA